jgi:hypothetical protein
VTNPEGPTGCAGKAWMRSNRFWAGLCGTTLAQEIGHNLGNQHWSNAHGELAGGGFEDRYPGEHGEVEDDTVGFDVIALQPVPARGESHTHDFMSYGDSPRWVSVRTWNDMAHLLQYTNRGLPSTPAVRVDRPGPSSVLAAGPPDPSTDEMYLASAKLKDVLLASGTVTGAKGRLEPLFLITDPGDPVRGDSPGEDYRLELRSRDGKLLAMRSASGDEPTHSRLAAKRFSIAIDRPSGIARADLFRGDERLAVRRAGPARPDVEITRPTAGSTWGADGNQTVSWRATDSDGDRLTYRAEVSQDGDRWLPLGAPTRSTELAVDLDSLPVEGRGWRLRVQASDGLNVGTATVGRLSSAARAPKPMILAPEDGTFVPPQTVVDLIGTAVTGAGRALPKQNLTWLADGEEIGRGARAWAAALEEGEHEIVLRAVQRGHPAGEARMKVVVGADEDRDRIADSWERSNDLDSADPSDSVEDGDGDTLTNWQEFRHGSDPRELDTDGDRYADHIEVAGSSDPADPDSIPMALHGLDNVPRLPGPVRTRTTWWVWPMAIGLGAVAVAGAAGALRATRRKTP